MNEDDRAEGNAPVDSHPYRCRCGSVVYWRGTPSGLTVLGADDQPHAPRCPRRDQLAPTPRDRYYRRHVARHADQDALMHRVVDALDETRRLGLNVARYAVQVDRRAASPPRGPPPQPPATSVGDPRHRGADDARAPERRPT